MHGTTIKTNALRYCTDDINSYTLRTLQKKTVKVQPVNRQALGPTQPHTGVAFVSKTAAA